MHTVTYILYTSLMHTTELDNNLESVWFKVFVNKTKLPTTLQKSDYDQEIPQSHTVDHTPRHHEEEPYTTNSHKTSGSHLK